VKLLVARGLLVVAVAALALSAGCRKAPEEQAEKLVRVTAVPITTKDITYELHRVGSLEAKESALLKSEAEGRVMAILFEEGDWVKEGSVLVKIDDAKIRTAMDQLKARLRQVEIQHANSLKTLKRKEPLVKEALVSEQEFDDLKAQIDIEKATIAEIKALLAHNQELLEDAEVRAPFPGVTSERQVSVGDLVRSGDPIVRLVQLDPLEISFQVDESYKTQLYVQQPVTLTVAAYPDQIFSGEVFFISPDIDINTRSFLVKGTITNQEHLLNPGMFAEVTIKTEAHKNALVVPWDSVVQLENEVYVYIVNSSVAHKIPVRLGQVTEQEAEVFGDFRPGQMVVTEGKFSLSEGTRVEVID